MTRPLIQVAEVALGRQRSPEHEDGDYPTRYLRSANVIDGALDLSDVKEMNFTPAERIVFSLRHGDVLVTEGSGSRETVGTSCVWRDEIEPPVCFQNTLLRLRPRPGIADGRYLAWWARHAHAVGLMAATAAGANILHLSAEALRRLPVPQVDIGRQQRIADFLDDQVARIDNTISARARQLALAGEEFRANRDEITLGRNELDEKTIGNWTPFGRIPRCWDQTLLRSVPATIQTGPFGSQLHSDEYVDDGWPVVNPAGLKESRIVSVPGMTVGDDVRARLARHVLCDGDVVFGRRGELGRAALVTDAEAGWVLGTGSLMVRLTRGGPLLPGFLLRLLETAALRFYFESVSVGSTMANLNVSILAAMPIVLPSLDAQRRVISVVSELAHSYSNTAHGLSRGIALLAELKTSLTTAAVTGEFDVSSADGSRVPV